MLGASAGLPQPPNGHICIAMYVRLDAVVVLILLMLYFEALRPQTPLVRLDELLAVFLSLFHDALRRVTEAQWRIDIDEQSIRSMTPSIHLSIHPSIHPFIYNSVGDSMDSSMHASAIFLSFLRSPGLSPPWFQGRHSRSSSWAGRWLRPPWEVAWSCSIP